MNENIKMTVPELGPKLVSLMGKDISNGKISGSVEEIFEGCKANLNLD